MKLQLEKQYKIDGPPWYRITVDDEFIAGGYDFDEVKRKFEEIKAHPNILKNEKEILSSEEI